MVGGASTLSQAEVDSTFSGANLRSWCCAGLCRAAGVVQAHVVVQLTDVLIRNLVDGIRPGEEVGAATGALIRAANHSCRLQSRLSRTCSSDVDEKMDMIKMVFCQN